MTPNEYALLTRAESAEYELGRIRDRLASAESRLRMAVDLMEDLLGLERGSGEKALAFINEFDRQEAA